MDTLLQDVRYAARKLLRTPGFTLIAVLTLALGIGATTAIFSVVNAVLLEPLPYREPERLVRIESSDRDGKATYMSPLDFIDYRDQSHSFDATAAIKAGESASLTRHGMPAVRVNSAIVGASFFSLLGVRPERGRVFAQGEDAQNAAKVVILSDALWQTHFGADPHVVGETVSLDGKPYTVVGVAPPRFTYPQKPDLWIPLVWQDWEIAPNNRGAHELFAIGRVRTGRSIESAGQELQEIARRLEQQYPKSNTGFGATVQPLQEVIVGQVRPALYALLGAVALVLLIACANVANLLLVRAATRGSEIAVRTALGAGRLRLVRQLVTESVLLSIVGAAVGTVLAAWAVDAVVAFGPRALPRLEEITIDGRVLAFTAALAVATGVLFGLVPALHAARPELSQMLRENARGTSRGGTQRTRSLLVVTEMALAVVLLVGAGLFIRSLGQLLHVDPGFRAERVIGFDVNLPDKYRYDRQRRAYAADLSQRLKRIPGTEAVAVAAARPIEPDAPFDATTVFDVAGEPPAPPGSKKATRVIPVSPDFFRTLRIPVVRGRVFTAAEDRPDIPPVVVVNQEFVRRYFKDRDPIGTRIILGMAHDTAESKADSLRSGGEIIGIVRDVKQGALSDEPYPATYVAYNTLPFGVSVVLRSTASPALVETAIRTQVRELDPDAPVYDLAPMEATISASVSEPRFYTILLGTFAGIALVLAALGIYGVLSYSVSQRTRELGIRLALGATPEGIVRLVIRGGLGLTVAGVVIGLVAALGVTRLIASLLFGVAPVDPPTLGAVCLVLLTVAVTASWLPARRAASVDPVVAMRVE